MAFCAGCHNAWPIPWTEPNKYGKRFILVGLVPQTYVGTDRTQFEAARPFVFTGAVGNYLAAGVQRQAHVPADVFSVPAPRPVLRNCPHKAQADRGPRARSARLSGAPLAAIAGRVYKAAPRDGVWATPPFMHNGSVPNLYEMLIPAAERTKKFYLGLEFDPVKVGLDTTATSGTFLMDTTLLGNSNAGHSFQNGPRGNGTIGPLLTDEQRWALVEYLKSIPEQPGRVTPFGGFPEVRLPQP